MARRRRGQFPQPKKENGQWKIRYYTDQAQPDGSTRRVRKTKCLGPVSSMTLTEARKDALCFIQPINEVRPGIEHGEKTLTHLIIEWRSAVKPTLKFSTQKNYEWAFAHADKELGQIPLRELDKAEVQAYLTRSSEHLAPESVRDLRARLRSLLTLGEDWGWVPPGSNPAAGRLRLPARVPVRDRRLPTPGQFRLLVDGLQQPYRTIVGLAGLTGLRRGELAALRWDDFDQGTLRVDEAVYRGRLGSPKTPRSRRIVKLSAKAIRLVEEWREIAGHTQPRDFVFSIRTNSPIDLNRAIERVVKPTAERLKLPRFSWHDFRHAYTTWGRRAGVAAEVMRDQMGHTSVLMTQDVYSHLEDDGGAARQIGDYVWPDEVDRTS